MFQAKAKGTLNLYELIRHRPETFLAVFSSVAGEIGSSTFSAYAAANSFQDNCCRYHTIHGFPHTFCLNWSMWDDMGVSKDNPEFARIATVRMGYRIISKREGWNSFLTAITRDEQRIYIGLDAGNSHLGNRIEQIPGTQKKVIVYLSAEGNGAVSAAVLAKTKEKLQDIIPFEIIRLHSIPRDSDGMIDEESLVRIPDEEYGMSSGRVAPRSGVERQIARIWADILHLEEIGIHDNFFDLGGNSLLIVKLSGILREKFSREISMTDLFRYPTIKTLSQFITGEKDKKATVMSLDVSRKRGAARRERTRKMRNMPE
jgi:acyl carrier protein